MKHTLEHGLLPIFRLYIVARLGVILSSGLLYFIWYGFSLGGELTPYVILFVADIVFLIVFLGWPWVPRHLGRIYLPIALIVASAIPLIEARYLYQLYGEGNAARLWLVFPFLSVPLILIAWQYELRHVVLYCAATALFDILLMVTIQPRDAMGFLAEMEMILARSVFFLLVGYIVANLVAVQREQRDELAEANHKLLRYTATLEQLTISRERNRMARELHDTLAHTLSGLAVQLDAILTLWQPNPAKAGIMLERALETTRAGLDETRRALQALRAKPLEDVGLALAVRGLAEDVAARSCLTLSLEVSERLVNLPPEVEQTFYRVAQEALENVSKHANARRLTVALRQRSEGLMLEIEDDGQGFAADSAAMTDRFGLRGMHERADLIGATLDVASSPERGTHIRLIYKRDDR